MKKLVVVLLLILLPTQAFADPAMQDIPPGPDKIVPLKQGEPAPFSGQLFETNTAIRWGNWLEQYKLRLQSDIVFEKKVADADLKLCQKKAELDRAADQRVIADLKTRLAETEKKLQPPPWYASPVLHFTLGAVTMANFVALTAWSLSALK